MLNSEDIRAKLDIIADQLNAIRRGTPASDTLRTRLLEEIDAKFLFYENGLDEDLASTPHTTRKVVEESDDESDTPEMKKELEGGETSALRGAVAAHEGRRPHNTPVSGNLEAAQALNFDDEDVSSAGATNSPSEETDDLEEDMKTQWWSLLGQHPMKMSRPLQKLLKRRLNLKDKTGLEIKTTATSKGSTFNLNQIRLTSTAHLYFCFDTPNEQLYAFFLWNDEMRNIAQHHLNYQHSPSRKGQKVRELSEDPVYHMQLDPCGLTSKGKFAWNWLNEHHKIEMKELPAFLVEHGFAHPTSE